MRPRSCVYRGLDSRQHAGRVSVVAAVWSAITLFWTLCPIVTLANEPAGVAWRAGTSAPVPQTAAEIAAMLNAIAADPDVRHLVRVSSDFGPLY